MQTFISPSIPRFRASRLLLFLLSLWSYFLLSSLPPRPSRAPSISSSSSFFFSAFSILSMAFHFSCTGCTHFNNYRPHFFSPLSPSLSPPPVSAFPLFFPQSIFASLLKPRPPFQPSILSSIHPYSTSRWIENKVLKRLSR